MGERINYENLFNRIPPKFIFKYIIRGHPRSTYAVRERGVGLRKAYTYCLNDVTSIVLCIEGRGGGAIFGILWVRSLWMPLKKD